MIRKFFLKRFRVFAICMMVPTLLIFGLSSYLFWQNVEETVKESGQCTVGAVITNIDLVLSNVLEQNDLLSNTARISMALEKVLNEQDLTYYDSNYIGAFRSVLDGIANAHDYIDSVYYYLDGSRNFFSSGSGVNNIANSSDSSWLEIYQKMERYDKNIMVSRSKNSIEDTITAVRKLLIPKGCIVVNINKEKLQKMVDSMCTTQYQTVFLMDANGKVLGYGQSSKKEDEALIAYVESKAVNSTDNSEPVIQQKKSAWISAGENKYNFYYDRYNDNNLYVVSAISSDARMEMLKHVFSTYALVLLVNCLLVGIIAYAITNRIFGQIRYMIDVFDNAEKGIYIEKPDHEPKDEYGIIMNNVIRLFLNNSYLTTQMKEKQYRQEATELKALQLQINPHFLYNTLQTLELEVRRGGNERQIVRVIQAVSDILKYSLGAPQEVVFLKEELEYLKKYVEIQQFRFEDSFVVYYEIDEDVLDVNVFKLMLQPIVENCLLHGLKKQKEKVYIKIKIVKQERNLKITVVDSGAGIEKERLKEIRERIHDDKSNNIGLTNVNRRLLLKYGNSSALRIQSKVGWGSCISFVVPLE